MHMAQHPILHLFKTCMLCRTTRILGSRWPTMKSQCSSLASTCFMINVYEAGLWWARKTLVQSAWRKWICELCMRIGPGTLATSPGNCFCLHSCCCSSVVHHLVYAQKGVIQCMHHNAGRRDLLQTHLLHATCAYTVQMTYSL